MALRQEELRSIDKNALEDSFKNEVKKAFMKRGGAKVNKELRVIEIPWGEAGRFSIFQAKNEEQTLYLMRSFNGLTEKVWFFQEEGYVSKIVTNFDRPHGFGVHKNGKSKQESPRKTFVISHNRIDAHELEVLAGIVSGKLKSP